MKPSARSSLLICSLAIASCSRASLPATPAGLAETLSAEKPDAASYRVISFDGADGAHPYGGLIKVGGSLYGTTESGGADTSGLECGAVFSVNATGGEDALYSFDDTTTSPDGCSPYAGLIKLNGKLVGTTYGGGTKGEGSVFSANRKGAESLVFSFDTKDGSRPNASLIAVNDTLYGTTEDGGSKGYGTVFSLSQTGERVLHSFKSHKDGAYPVSSLIDVKGTLYGTTSTAGSGDDGTVFTVSAAGKESILYSFRGESHNDGNGPYSGLIDVKGTLYGTTVGGGKMDDGTVFSISTTGVEHVLHSFGISHDGAGPYANLIDVKGTLYGTTKDGGTKNMGTVFSISTTGVEHVLHNFTGGADGANPVASLLDVNGTLYGTTVNGGSKGDGTVFALTP
jgi:uncharacterized repeat protein (TIGR03803 family)